MVGGIGANPTTSAPRARRYPGARRAVPRRSH